MKDQLVSVIIPVYNVENYIVECLESVIHQTYKNLQIIVIDDGSTDSSGVISDQYSNLDTRIYVVHQKNSGLSVARNKGIRLASAEYILFVDGDDRISPNTVEIAMSQIEKNDSDICFFNYQLFFGNNFKEDPSLERREIVDESVVKPQKCIELLLQHKFVEAVWNGIYKRETLEHVDFPVGKISEDLYWKFKVILAANKILMIPDCLYYYRGRAQSIMHSPFSWKRFDELEGRYYRANEISKMIPDLKTLAYSDFLSESMLFYTKIKINFKGDQKEKAIKKVEDYVEKMRLKLFEIIIEKRISMNRKISLIIMCFSFKGACALKNLILQAKE